MTVAENIKRIRKEKGLTQKQLGAKCGMAESTLRQYEIGYRNPKIITLRRIADGLGVTLGELIGDDYQSVYSDPYFAKSVTPSRAVEILENMYDVWEEAGFSASNPPKTKEDRKKIYPIGRRRELLEAFDSLNNKGKGEAVNRIRELTEIPRYTKPDTPELNAAHADNYADAPEELKEREEKMMDDEDF